jgi:hypothetical protein
MTAAVNESLFKDFKIAREDVGRAAGGQTTSLTGLAGYVAWACAAVPAATANETTARNPQRAAPFAPPTTWNDLPDLRIKLDEWGHLAAGFNSRRRMRPINQPTQSAAKAVVNGRCSMIRRT